MKHGKRYVRVDDPSMQIHVCSIVYDFPLRRNLRNCKLIGYKMEFMTDNDQIDHIVMLPGEESLWKLVD